MNKDLVRGHGAIKFSSVNQSKGSNQKRVNQPVVAKNYGRAANDLEEIKEEYENIDESQLPEVPGYFHMFDADQFDSEEELVSGENNFHEIKCYQDPKEEAKNIEEEEKKGAGVEEAKDKNKDSSGKDSEKKNEAGKQTEREVDGRPGAAAAAQEEE